MQVASVSVSKNTSIWVLSMIPSLVFSVWTFTLSSRDPEAESVSEEDAKLLLDINTKFPRMKLWNGSRENTMVPSTTDRYLNLSI